MGTLRNRRGKYKIKQSNIEKLREYLKRVKDGEQYRLGKGTSK